MKKKELDQAVEHLTKLVEDAEERILKLGRPKVYLTDGWYEISALKAMVELNEQLRTIQ